MTERAPRALAALMGVVCAAVAVGVGELVAVLFRPAASPVIAVGNRVIVLTPEDTKQTTIQAAGTNDKLVLLASIYLLLAAFGAVIGVLAVRRLSAGLAGIALVAAFGCYCALTQNASRGSDVVPTLVGCAAAMAALVVLTRQLLRWSATTDGADSADGADGADGTAAAPERRAVLLTGAGTAVLAALAGFGGRAAQRARFDVGGKRNAITLPPAADATGMPPGTDLGRSGVPWVTPNKDFYRIDTALTVPQVDPDTWQLRIHGRVDREVVLSYRELLARPLVERWITLNCVSNAVGGNLIGNARWRGALLADLLREAGLHADCDQLLLTSVDGMTIGAPAAVVMDGRPALIAVGMNGKPLPIVHGFPARTVVPGLYGYVSACKWIVDINATTFAEATPYWVQGGWAKAPPIRLASRIDRPSASEVVRLGEPVAVAGVAWDQHVGVSRVEVQVGDGAWQAARLARVPSADTWRQWVLVWTPTRPGDVRLRVRAFDAAGRAQDVKRRDAFPSGATGLHSVTVHVE